MLYASSKLWEDPLPLPLEINLKEVMLQDDCAG